LAPYAHNFGGLRHGFKGGGQWEIFATGNTGLVVGQPGDPRTYGITVSKNF
jgi:iron complex outermembrane receptor protein